MTYRQKRQAPATAEPKPTIRIRLQGSSDDILYTLQRLRGVIDIIEDSGTYKENALDKNARRYLIIKSPRPPKPVRGRQL